MTWIVLSICLAWLVAAEGEVFILTDDNFESTINAGKAVLVKFYAPWCSHCQALAPEYSKLAEEMKRNNNEIVIAELDATVQVKTAVKYDIQSYPTIKFFVDATPVDYAGSNTRQALLDFIKEKLQPVCMVLTTKDELEERANEEGKKCFLVSNNQEDLRNFVNAAKSVKNFRFFHTSEELGKQVFPRITKPSVVVRRDFYVQELIYTDSFAPEKLIPYLRRLQFDVLTEFNDEIADMVFDKAERGAVFLIQGEKTKPKVEKEFLKFAKAKQSEDFIFTKINSTDSLGKRLVGYFGISEAELPIVEIFDVRNQSNARYRFNGKIKLAALEEFMDKYSRGEITRFLKSEPIPESNSGPVYKVVGNNFKEEVLDNDNDVLVMFYSDKCGHCKRLVPIYTSVAEKVKHNEKLRLTEFDAIKNEVMGVTFVAFPTLYLFPAGRKAHPIKYEEERSEESIMNFLKEKCTNPIELPKTDL